MTRIAIVGCGAALEYVHRSAIDRLRRSGSLEIVAVVDPDASMRSRASQWFEPAMPCRNLADAIEKDISAVLVLSPPSSHVGVILESLSYGMDVFCEKPLAEGFAATSSLMENPERQRVSIGMIRRQFDTSTLLRGNLNTLVDVSDFRIQYSEGGPYSWPIVSELSFRRDAGGVGVILDTGIHTLDLLTWIFGPADLRLESTDETSDTVARNASLNLEFAGGTASIRLSWTDPLPPGLRIESRLGSVWVPPGALSVVFHRSKGEKQWGKLSAGNTAGPSWLRYHQPRCSNPQSAALLQLSEFLGPSRGRLASVEEAAAVLEMLDRSS
jgi:predicted dehydrogenase